MKVRKKGMRRENWRSGVSRRALLHSGKKN
jgi:hypothetical protein